MSPGQVSGPIPHLGYTAFGPALGSTVSRMLACPLHRQYLAQDGNAERGPCSGVRPGGEETGDSLIL